ncbi:hypothetical protein ACJD0Z_11235 [Flavobacteriaceae bacterium M23B6Z8]
MKKQIVKGSLKLNKKTIGNLNGIQGGRPPGTTLPAETQEYRCTQPITIETICWTDSRDIASNCWCSSDDSFVC